MGWLLVAGIGLMVGGPLGAIGGGAKQHGFSRATRPRLSGRVNRPSPVQVFVSYLVATLTNICMVDGSFRKPSQRPFTVFSRRGGFVCFILRRWKRKLQYGNRSVNSMYYKGLCCQLAMKEKPVFDPF